MQTIKRNQTPALVIVLLVLFSAAMIYFAARLPSYSPYYLDEHFTNLDPNVWEIGGAKNYSLSNGVLTLFGSTNATHYFVTNPKWQSPIPETRLEGRLVIVFKADAAVNGSVVVATTDSWSALAFNGTLRLDLNGSPSVQTTSFVTEMGSGWHTLVAESGPTTFNMSLDGRVIAVADRWNGNLTQLELGTGMVSFDGLKVHGDLEVSAVRADLQPLVLSDMLTPWNVVGQGLLGKP